MSNHIGFARCINSRSSWLTDNAIYDVYECDESDEEYYKCLDDTGNIGIYYRSRFELLEDYKPAPKKDIKIDILNITKEGSNMNDNVNHPSHYTQGKFETIEVIKDITSDFNSYLVGNIIKYVSRYKYKNGLEDLKKAKWYLEKLINEVEIKEFEEITSKFDVNEGGI